VATFGAAAAFASLVFAFRAGLPNKPALGAGPQTHRAAEETERGPSFGGPAVPAAGALCATLGRDSSGVVLTIREEPEGATPKVHIFATKDPRLAMANGVMAVRRLPRDRVFVDCHVNPSLGIGVVADLASGKLRLFAGCRFAWDGKGENVAYFRDPPHWAPQGAGRTELYLNEEKLCNLAPRSVKEIWWSADQRVLVAEVSDRAPPGSLLLVDLRENAPAQLKWYVPDPEASSRGAHDRTAQGGPGPEADP
jgi:hypothetical protein